MKLAYCWILAAAAFNPLLPANAEESCEDGAPAVSTDETAEPKTIIWIETRDAAVHAVLIEQMAGATEVLVEPQGEHPYTTRDTIRVPLPTTNFFEAGTPEAEEYLLAYAVGYMENCNGKYMCSPGPFSDAWNVGWLDGWDAANADQSTESTPVE